MCEEGGEIEELNFYQILLSVYGKDPQSARTTLSMVKITTLSMVEIAIKFYPCRKITEKIWG